MTCQAMIRIAAHRHRPIRVAGGTEAEARGGSHTGAEEQTIHRGNPERILKRLHAFTGRALILSLLVAPVVHIAHGHEGEDESAADCSVCQLAEAPGYTTGSYTPDPAHPASSRASMATSDREAPAALHFSPHRSRAPPSA